MKPQDLLFIVVLIGLLATRKPKWLVIAGLISLALSIPIFGSLSYLFTAQRLAYYAWGFFLVATILLLVRARK